MFLIAYVYQFSHIKVGLLDVPWTDLSTGMPTESMITIWSPFFSHSFMYLKSCHSFPRAACDLRWCEEYGATIPIRVLQGANHALL